MKLIVIVPTYNEAESLPRLVSALFLIPLDVSLLVVDDNSPDGTGELADRISVDHPGKVSVIHRPGKLGLRSAYLMGFKQALESEVDAVVQMDADFSHDPACLEAMADRLVTCQVVLGSRYIKGGRVDERWSIWRKALSAWGNFYASTILRMPIRDVTTGYRMWRADALRGLPLERVQSNGYVFLVEMAYLAHQMGYKFGEVPIYFADRRFGRSKMSFRIQVEAALRIWQLLWTYRDLRSK
ncbi:MAG: glycosyl transferase [Chloroflexi bacterium GWB2_49_20]|nr:MAG: glycosyl transferase [Chloroflexi bacterium GWB2_49_20]OGN78501.1 MAG: glycosyl transferase [Chloroflexi bacterium GWC2_49_37]OGN84036.1 MAG: glycosyl transferase [Chloroflexi bacterium GWD2_49_16]HBG75322.1 polyprenol monophosphomannose synthase [Anaerolineae bacterium]HCC79044.1 polyprenol monophosphomannose synthase [Anaerolineae bacterium]